MHSVAYDRKRLVLELEMNTGERFQHFSVPRGVAIGVLQAHDPAKYIREFIDGVYRFERVRVQRRSISRILVPQRPIFVRSEIVARRKKLIENSVCTPTAVSNVLQFFLGQVRTPRF
jgi:KTSC domain-containing protein